jgi:hypothetical protein
MSALDMDLKLGHSFCNPENGIIYCLGAWLDRFCLQNETLCVSICLNGDLTVDDVKAGTELLAVALNCDQDIVNDLALISSA